MPDERNATLPQPAHLRSLADGGEMPVADEEQVSVT
jgi:hypothetical protein